MSVDEILTFYDDAGAEMFTKANLLRRLRYKFESEPLAQETAGGARRRRQSSARTKLGRCCCSSCAMPRPIRRGRSRNNPYAKYNDPSTRRQQRRSCRCGSSCARVPPRRPTFRRRVIVFRPPDEGEGVHLRRRRRHDVQQSGVPDVSDGDARPYGAKPARWATGADQMLIVSVGTGTSPDVNASLQPGT